MSDVEIPADFFRISPAEAPAQQTQTSLVTVGDPGSPPVPIEAIAKLAVPLINAYVEADREKQQRRLAFEEKRLEAATKQDRTLLSGLFVLGMTVLFLAGVLIFSGREAAAIDLVKTFATIGGVGFGGYGIAAMRNKESKEE
jgi:hypothetical protein